MKRRENVSRAAQVVDVEAQYVNLARLALAGKMSDVELLSRRTLARLQGSRPDLSDQIASVLKVSAAASEIARTKAAIAPLPVDLESRLELLKRELAPQVDLDPTWSPEVRTELETMLAERERSDELTVAGLSPSRSVLLVGPPGVGKTLAARWLAHRLQRTLLTLDLSSVMSSFLGKTGANIRVVLDFARRQPSVLLLDEFDAIAKRRDDTAEVGELKRLVTVLIQAIDDWPSDGLLVAATNHPELLDPAIWRRFDRVIEFPLPTKEEIENLLSDLVDDAISPSAINGLSLALQGKSHAEITREVLRAKRQAVLSGENLSALMTSHAVSKERGTVKERLAVANDLRCKGYSEREISQRTGLSRQTLSKYRDHNTGVILNGTQE